MHVETLGTGGPRVVFVHGSVTPGWMTWNAQKPLAARFTLVVPSRSGYPPNPPLDRIDFELQARELRDLLEPGDHVVAHSYGGVVSLLAAPGAPLGSSPSRSGRAGQAVLRSRAASSRRRTRGFRSLTISSR
jgi:pimeloyl-ACP methyl ester carboxylesterase